jgi:hypothetical protein
VLGVRRLALGVAILLGAAQPAAAQPDPGWLTWGNGEERTGFAAAGPPPRFARSWFAQLEGRVTSQPLVANDVPAPGQRTVFAVTTAGGVHALAPNGYVRWERDYGQLPRPCPQLDGYGLTGTPAIDPATRSLLFVDPFGRLHALDLATGEERRGWPVTVVRDFLDEHVFGALTVVDGSVYVPTASYCDRPMEGKLVRVALATRAVSNWVAVPFRLGGGGGIWGFGGAAWSERRGSLFVATGNAFEGGENVGEVFKEWAGYGEHLVELSPALEVRSASHPADVDSRQDLDFGSAPVVFARAGCPELVAAVNKNGVLYTWRTDTVADGPAWQLALRTAPSATPVIGQPAWSPRHGALFVTTGARLLRVTIRAACTPRVAWRLALPAAYLQGSPSVARDLVWLSASGARQGLLGVDARTGKVRFRHGLGGDSYAAPAIAGGSLYVGTFGGGLHGFLPRAVRSGAAATDRAEYVSRVGDRLAWASRENGVFATEDGGRTWRRIYAFHADRVVRASRTAGLISTGFPAVACGCRTRILWTTDGGRRWREARGVGARFEVSGRRLAWHDGRTLRETAWPPARGTVRSSVVARFSAQRIVGLEAAPGGFVALLSNRVRGQGWDNAPRVLVRRDGRSNVMTLPSTPGRVLARDLLVTWPRIVVAGRSYTPVRGGTALVGWRSNDGGATWSVIVLSD